MKSAARILLGVLAALLFSLGFTYAASSLSTMSWAELPGAEPSVSPAPGTAQFSNFQPRTIPELQQGRPLPVVSPPEFPPPPPNGEWITSHRQAFTPPSQKKPMEVGTALPLVNRMPPGYADINGAEDARVFSSHLYTDTSAYLNWIDKNRSQSSKNRETFYEQNLRYEMYSTNRAGDSLSVTVDTTHSNDNREYENNVLLNQVSFESRTARSQLVLGHAFPEFSPFTMTSRMAGLYGTQKLDSTEVRGFTGYRAIEKDDLRNPRFVSGVRVEHSHDRSATIGINAVTTRDVHEKPSSDVDLPTLSNQVYSFDVNLKPTDNIYVDAEYAGSVTEFDQRNDMGEQDATGYRAKAGYERENYRVEGGVEEAGTAFLTPLGESPRDEQAFFGNIFYELNRYVSGRVGGRSSRDNLSGYKTITLNRDQPEVQFTLRPSEYYKDLRIDLFYQPLHEYSGDGEVAVDRYRDLMWLEMQQKAGAMRYFAGLSSTIDRDNRATANDRDVNKLDLKLTWEYDAFRRLYGLYSLEQLHYKTLGGKDHTAIYGLGGRSQFHEDLTLALDYTHEENMLKDSAYDSSHDRMNLSFIKEYNNFARFIIDLEGSNNQFDLTGRSWRDLTARMRFLRSF